MWDSPGSEEGRERATEGRKEERKEGREEGRKGGREEGREGGREGGPRLMWVEGPSHSSLPSQGKVRHSLRKVPKKLVFLRDQFSKAKLRGWSLIQVLTMCIFSDCIISRPRFPRLPIERVEQDDGQGHGAGWRLKGVNRKCAEVTWGPWDRSLTQPGP